MSASPRRRFVSGTLALAAVAALSLNPLSSALGTRAFAADSKTIKIGVDLPLSGGEAASNIPTQNAVLLAVEEANAKGLPHGYKLEAYVLDDTVQGKHDPAQGAQNVRTLIADSSVLGFVGPANSSVAKAEIPLSNEAGLVQIAASTTADGLTRGPDAAKLRVAHPDVNSFFRLSTLDSRQGAAGASFAKKLGLSKAFIIDDNETYGKGLADVFEQQFSAHGGTILGHEHLTPTQTDFVPLLTKTRATGADVIFFGGVSVTGGGLLRRQQVSNGLGKIPLLGGDGLAGGDFLQTAGAAADGTYYTLSAPDVTRLPGAARFVQTYKARFKEDPGPYSANGYAAAKIIIAAITKALTAGGDALPTRAQILKIVADTKDFQTPVGAIGFDQYGDTTAPILSLYKVQSSKAEFISQIDLKE
jgi:branched-chain amino acid transport system substrate-binding protein